MPLHRRLPPLLVWLAIAAAASAAGAPQAGSGAVLEQLNRARAEHGLAPLEPAAVLDGAAAELAAEIAATGEVDSRQEDISRISRRLLAAGYAAHAWSERVLVGGPDLASLTAGLGIEAAGLTELALGDFEQVGVGLAEGGDEIAVLVVLAALPRLSFERRQAAAALGDLDAVRGAVLAAVNGERRRRRLAEVRAEPRLDLAAQDYARDMLEGGFYSHRDPAGGSVADRVRAAGYPGFSIVAENIAKGLFTPGEVVERWLASSGHRRNILLRQATETGLGVAWGERGDSIEVLWVQIFAHPR